MYAIGQVVIPFLHKQDKRFGVSRINRIERALFNNRKLAIEAMRQSVHFERLCRILVESMFYISMIYKNEIRLEE